MPVPSSLAASSNTTLADYDRASTLMLQSAAQAGQAAARDPRWRVMAMAWRDLADIHETARAEYAAALTHHALPSETANLRALHQAARTRLTTIDAACRAAP